METLTVARILEGRRRGSSRPVIVEVAEAPSERRLVKLRGAAQGAGALVAEIVVASLAEALGLNVPPRTLLRLEPSTPVDDRDAELADLLHASEGLNLGFEILDGARDFGMSDAPHVSAREKAAILWLDRWVLNPDRTRRNPNLLWRRDQPWLIDHGASLRFQYNWDAVTEDSPREVGVSYEPHLFDEAADRDDWSGFDQDFARLLDRATVERAVASVPRDFLLPLLRRKEIAGPVEQLDAIIAARREAYVRYLMRRLEAPRPFALEPAQYAPSTGRGIPPDWVEIHR